MKSAFLVIGFAIPDDLMKEIQKEDKLLAMQTHKFNWNLIKSLETSKKNEYIYISTRPVSDYPYYSKKWIRKGGLNQKVGDKDIKIQEISFINISIFKLITRFFSSFIASIKYFFGKKNKSGIIIYSVHVPFMAVGWLLSIIFNVELIGVWTDPPAESHSYESKLKSRLRNIERTISLFLMKKYDKVISLTDSLAEDFAPGKKYIVIEGILDPVDIENAQSPIVKNERNIVYTGTLAKKYGIKNIVEGFLLANIDNMYLDIYGSGDFEDELIKYARINDNIRYHGLVSNEIAQQRQREATFLINARSSDDVYVKYSFPSKTMEYLASGTPLITTMLPSIPVEYLNHIIELEDNNPETIAKVLREVNLLSTEELKEFSSKAQKFILTRSYFNQGEKINNFISRGETNNAI